MPSVGYSPQRHFDFLKEMTAVGRRTLDQTSAAISTSSRRWLRWAVEPSIRPPLWKTGMSGSAIRETPATD